MHTTWEENGLYTVGDLMRFVGGGNGMPMFPETEGLDSDFAAIDGGGGGNADDGIGGGNGSNGPDGSEDATIGAPPDGDGPSGSMLQT